MVSITCTASVALEETFRPVVIWPAKLEPEESVMISSVYEIFGPEKLLYLGSHGSEAIQAICQSLR